MARTNSKIDLTQGPIASRVLMFALPICLGSILQQLYGMVDTLVVGNFCGPISLAAVGTSSLPVEMFLCLFTGLGTGVTILVSQAVGSGDTQRLRSAVQSTVSFLYLCGIPLTILGLLFGHLLLALMQTPADTWDLAVDYTRILFLGTLGNLGYNVNAGILRGMGDSRSTLNFLIISCITNIVLDLLFVPVLGMGVSGAAWATIIAMYVSWITSMFYIRRKYPESGYVPFPRSFDKAGVGEIIRVGLPLGINSSIFSVGHLCLQAFINAQGSIFMAGCSVAGKVNSLATIAVQSLSSSCTSFAGQNLGARRYDRLAKGGWLIPLFAGLVSFTGCMIALIFLDPLLRLFNSDPAVLEMARLYCHLTLPMVWCYAVFSSMQNTVYGLGVMKYPTAISIMMLWVVRIPVAWAICTFGNGHYLPLSFPASFVAGMIGMSLFYCSPRWKEIRSNAKHMLEEKKVS